MRELLAKEATGGRVSPREAGGCEEEAVHCTASGHTASGQLLSHYEGRLGAGPAASILHHFLVESHEASSLQIHKERVGKRKLLRK